MEVQLSHYRPEQLSTNYRYEQQAATQAMSHLIKQAISNTNIVFLIDCKSVLQSVQNESQDNATRNVKRQFIIISRTNNAVFQWISAHCGITGNQSADKLAKQTSECQQHRHTLLVPEMKTLVKGKFNTAGKTRTGSTYPSDPIMHLNRREQTMILRQRTGHCRLGAHLFKLKVVTTPRCHCNTEHQTPERVLQICPTYESIMKSIWSEPKTIEEKRWGERYDRLLSVEFVEASNSTI